MGAGGNGQRRRRHFSDADVKPTALERRDDPPPAQLNRLGGILLPCGGRSEGRFAAALAAHARALSAANGHAKGHTEDTASEHLTTIGGLIAAPPVSSVTHPEDFGAAFRRRKSRREGESKGPRSSRAGGFADPVPFAVASVPPALADEAVAEAIEAFGVSKEAADAIDAAFEIRTVWAHEALLESVPATLVAKAKTEGAILERAFPLFAFRFKDGPFRRLWVRRGYDPRVRARDEGYAGAIVKGGHVI